MVVASYDTVFPAVEQDATDVDDNCEFDACTLDVRCSFRYIVVVGSYSVFALIKV